MGAGIAEVSAKAGADVMVFEPTEELVTAGRKRITASLERAASKGKLSEADRDAALAKLTFTTSLADLSDRQLVIEAVVEDEAVKGKIFAELDELITDPDAVLASNTSSIPIMKIAAATKNPSRVLGLHFFNPVPVLPLVELISTLVTSDEPSARTEEFASGVLGKQVVRCGTGRVSSSTRCWCRTCSRRSGWPRPASPPSRTSTRPSWPGCRIRWGRCGCRDLIGLDTMKLIADKMYDEYKEPLYAPPPLLLRMVEAGQLGKKSGKGFYTY